MGIEIRESYGRFVAINGVMLLAGGALGKLLFPSHALPLAAILGTCFLGVAFGALLFRPMWFPCHVWIEASALHVRRTRKGPVASVPLASVNPVALTRFTARFRSHDGSIVRLELCRFSAKDRRALAAGVRRQLGSPA